MPVAGVIPWFNDIYIAEEDALGLPPNQPGIADSRIKIAVIRLPHLSNFDDFDPLISESGASLKYVSSVEELEGADLIILPGSKTTMSDLTWLRHQKLDAGIIEQHKRGAFVIGICGGFQMLGKSIFDPNKVESSVAEEQGLGLLPISTTFLKSKQTHQVKGKVVAESGLLAKAKGVQIEGYEIHMGVSHGHPGMVPFSIAKPEKKTEDEGAMDAEGRVLGTYIHGLFNNIRLRRTMLDNIASAKDKPVTQAAPSLNKDAEYDKLAALVRGSLDMKLIYYITGLR